MRWWRLDLATGQALPAVADPRSALKSGTGARWSVAAKAVPGTPLILVQWWSHASTRGPRGSVFSLHTPDGRPVWELSWPGDLSHADHDEQQLIQERAAAGGGLAAVGSGSFTLWRATGNERVRFDVRREGEEWSVSARDPVAPAEPGAPRGVTPAERRGL